MENRIESILLLVVQRDQDVGDSLPRACTHLSNNIEVTGNYIAASESSQLLIDTNRLCTVSSSHPCHTLVVHYETNDYVIL